MKDLNKKAFKGLIGFIVFMAALLFIPAGTLTFWEAWTYLAVFSVMVFAITLYLMKYDQKLLESRMHVGVTAEKEMSQKIILGFLSLAFLALFIVSGLDHRFGWSSITFGSVIVGNIMVIVGLYIIFLVFKENTHTSAIVEIQKDHKIISTGPYAVVRHPMYIGALIMIFGTPIALGSWWGIIACIVITITIIVRILEEEKFLTKNLHGYSGYQKKVKYRLIPFIW